MKISVKTRLNVVRTPAPIQLMNTFFVMNQNWKAKYVMANPNTMKTISPVYS